jgi:hypothetical protein
MHNSVTSVFCTECFFFLGTESKQRWSLGDRTRFESESSGQGLYMFSSKCNSYVINFITCNEPSIFFCHILICTDHMP